MDPKSYFAHLPLAAQITIIAGVLKSLDQVISWLLKAFRSYKAKLTQTKKEDTNLLEKWTDSNREHELTLLEIKKDHRAELADKNAEIHSLKAEIAKLRKQGENKGRE